MGQVFVEVLQLTRLVKTFSRTRDVVLKSIMFTFVIIYDEFTFRREHSMTHTSTKTHTGRSLVLSVTLLTTQGLEIYPDF